jgi:hypothetical protein
MQVQDFVPGAVKYSGVSDAVVSIIRAEGWTALYKGLAANYCKVATLPVTALASELFKFNDLC